MTARVVLGLLIAVTAARAATFYCDPIHGSPQGDGSNARPWQTIEEVLQARRIQFRDRAGHPANPEAPVKPGDTILLRSGWHGVIRIAGGYNEQYITIAADPGHAPQVGWIEIGEGRKWCLRGITVSPSLAPSPLERVPHDLVMLGEQGGEESAELVVEDCFISTALDTRSWTAEDWVQKTASGIWLGRHGRAHVARNNYILNTRFGINLCAPDCLAEGNVVANFSADGVRVTRDGQTVQYNVIKNVFVNARDGDDNHDDGIQAFLFNVGTGTLRNVTLRGNIILARETDSLPFPNELQGIGCFDGPLVHFTVEKNVVGVNHWHGITLGDAQGCSILDNVCFSRWSGRAWPWVQLGQKKNQAAGNTVRNNFAHTFDFRADASVEAENNREVTEAVFNQRLTELARDIDRRFGERHPTAKRPRLESAPARTSLSDPTLRFTASPKPYVVLRCEPLTAVVVDNRAVDDEVLPGHRAGYSGLGALRHERQARNLFVPAYAGLNLEHILDGTQQERTVLFEPRNAPMELRVIDERTAELYQPPTPHYRVESCQRFQLLDNGIIELTFECIPRAETWRHGYLHFFWASYIDRPEVLDTHFLGRPETDAAAPPIWVRGITSRHGERSTHRAVDDDRSFAHVEPFPLELPFSFSGYRYAEPWYFGLCRGMAFAQLFRPRDGVRFAQSPSGGGNGCPAWDFQWFIERPQVGQRYQLVMRGVYTPVPEGADDVSVRAHLRRRAEEARQTAAPPGAASGF